MEKRKFGKTGMELSVLGFGGAEIGFQGVDAQKVQSLLHAALDAGLNIIDTAECYVNSEELIGDAVGTRRSDFYLFTKCGHKDHHFAEAWSGSDIEHSIDRSLKRLKTDYIDLVQLHSCDQATLEKGEAIEALQKAKKAGKTRFIGYSGDSKDARFAIETGVFDTLQTSVSIADQECIELTLPLAQKKNMGVIAKRPIANAAWTYDNPKKDEYCRPYWERLQELSYSFINGDAKKTAETALRFTLSVPGVHTMIVGTTKPGRWQENAELVRKGALSPAEYEQIRKTWQQVAKESWVGQV
jgi:aryl-alcohol dehydrogenase-like predicted oxidoreductase